MYDSLGTVLAAIIPGIVRLIIKAIAGDDVARRRLSDIMEGDEARSTVERALDEAAIKAKFGG